MLRIVEMHRTGVYVALRNGSVTSLGGRSFWSDLTDLREAVRQANTAASDFVIRTKP